MSELFVHQFFAFQTPELSFCHVVDLHQVTLLVKVDDFLILHQMCTFKVPHEECAQLEGFLAKFTFKFVRMFLGLTLKGEFRRNGQ